VAYTLPRIAQIGLTPEEGNADPDKYDVKVLPYGKGFDTRHEDTAEMTIIFEKATQKVVGAVIYGGQAASLINILTFVVDKGLTNDDLEQMIFGFPDVSYSILGMLNPNGAMG
jgi:glutathione reductase (NADPH)